MPAASLCEVEGPARRRRSWPALAGCALGCALWASAASAATITVNTTEDLIANDGHCSLREAITAANLDKASGSQGGECPHGEGPDTIVLPAGVYRLTRHGANEDGNSTGDLDLSSNVTLDGAGIGATTIDGDAQAAGESSDRVIQVIAAPMRIDGVSIEHGRPSKQGSSQDGGGILIGAGSTATVSNSAVNNDAAGEGPLNTRGGNGGGIANLGELTVSSSEIDENATGPSFSGPGFATGIGGGIWNVGTLTVVDSVLFENSVTLRPGNGPLPGGGGGAIANAGPSATIEATTLSTNSASPGGEGSSTGGVGGEGGAILNTTGALTLTDSAVFANEAGHGGSGIAAPKGGEGGGVAIKGGSATFVNDTFNGNASGAGGISGGEPNNPSANGGDGAAIAASGGTLSLANLTIADNLTGAGGAAAPFPVSLPGQRGRGAVAISGSAKASVQATILADNEGGNCFGSSPEDAGHNIAFGGSGCPAGFSGGDPALGPLQDNGGPTSTMALGAGSAALDQLPADEDCPQTDQRGVSRPQGPACDIGAYELAPTPPAANPGPAPTSSPGTTQTPTPVRRVAPVLGPLSLSPATFRPAPSGASIAKKRKPSGSAVSYNDSDAATTTFTVLRSQHGVRKNGRCVAPPRHGHGGRPCTRFAKVGAFTHADRPGRNGFRFSGRVGGSALKPGSYELEATPRLAGLAGAPRTARFAIAG